MRIYDRSGIENILKSTSQQQQKGVESMETTIWSKIKGKCVELWSYHQVRNEGILGGR